MTYILLATLAGFALLNIWFSERRITIARTGDLFMLVWFYYGFAIAIDLILGLEIRGIPGMVNLSDPEMMPVVSRVLMYYLACGGAFMLMYVMPGKNQPAAIHRDLNIRLPSLAIMVGFHVLALYYGLGGYLHLSRMERALLINDSSWYRAVVLAMAILRAMDLVYVMACTDKRKIFVVVLMSILMGAIVGDRSEMMAIVLCAALKCRLSCSRKTFLAVAAGLIFVLGTWKSVYTYSVHYFTGEGLARGALAHAATSLSGIESYASCLVFATYLENETPWLLGRTYLIDPLYATLPMGLRPDTFMTLSQAFVWEYAQKKAETGGGTGFSALAESWINFGWLGPIILGLVWGCISRSVDCGYRGIGYIVFALLTFRLFRTDFASLWKSWVVIQGGGMILALGLFRMIGSLPIRPRPGQHWNRGKTLPKRRIGHGGIQAPSFVHSSKEAR